MVIPYRFSSKTSIIPYLPVYRSIFKTLLQAHRQLFQHLQLQVLRLRHLHLLTFLIFPLLSGRINALLLIIFLDLFPMKSLSAGFASLLFSVLSFCIQVIWENCVNLFLANRHGWGDVALVSHRTWNLVTTLLNASIVGCCYVSTVKYKADRLVDCYKTCFVAKGFS